MSLVLLNTGLVKGFDLHSSCTCMRSSHIRTWLVAQLFDNGFHSCTESNPRGRTCRGTCPLCIPHFHALIQTTIFHNLISQSFTSLWLLQISRNRIKGYMCPRGTSKFTKHDRPCKGKVSNARTMLPRNPNKAAAGIAPPTQAPDAAAFPQRAPAAASTRRKLPGLAQPSPIKTSSGSFNVPFMCKPPPRELLGLVQDPDPAGVDPTAAGHVIPGSLVKGELL